MKTQKIKLFKTWHKLLIAGIWVGATAWIFANVFHGAITPTRVLTIIAYSGAIGAFITAFPYMFLHNYLASKAGLPIAYDAGDDECNGYHYWGGQLCFGVGHSPVEDN